MRRLTPILLDELRWRMMMMVMVMRMVMMMILAEPKKMELLTSGSSILSLLSLLSTWYSRPLLRAITDLACCCDSVWYRPPVIWSLPFGFMTAWLGKVPSGLLLIASANCPICDSSFAMDCVCELNIWLHFSKAFWLEVFTSWNAWRSLSSKDVCGADSCGIGGGNEDEV